MRQPVWISIEPRGDRVQLLLSQPEAGTALKARLPLPQHNQAFRLLLEALSTWYARPITAVLDADAQDVCDHPVKWGLWLGDLDGLEVGVRWLRGAASRPRDRYFEGMGEFSHSRKLLNFCGTGQR